MSPNSADHSWRRGPSKGRHGTVGEPQGSQWLFLYAWFYAESAESLVRQRQEDIFSPSKAFLPECHQPPSTGATCLTLGMETQANHTGVTSITWSCQAFPLMSPQEFALCSAAHRGSAHLTCRCTNFLFNILRYSPLEVCLKIDGLGFCCGSLSSLH